MKIALILQYCKYDFDQMAKTCRLIEALEPEFNKNVDFVFSVKKGAPEDERTYALMGNKFKTFVFRGVRTEEGWPAGPNAQWCETMDWAYGMVKKKKADWDYVFTTEPDIVPLTRDWLAQLMAFIEKFPAPVVGVRMPHPDHINGNAFFRPEYAASQRMYGCPGQIAWDVYWANINVQNAVHCPLMKNIYNINDRTAVTEGSLYGKESPGAPDPVYVHGIKGDKGIEIVAKKLGLNILPPKPFATKIQTQEVPTLDTVKG